MDSSRRYDCLIPFGFNCAPAHQLKIRKLRRYSLPFDWLWAENSGDALEHNLRLIETRFSGWLQAEHLEYADRRDLLGAGGRTSVRDKMAGLTFLHDFFTMGDPAELEQVREKYARRINRLYTVAGAAGRILLLVFGTSRQLDRERLVDAQARFRKVFPQAEVDIFAVITKSSRMVFEADDATGLYVAYTTRETHPYDYEQTSPEWAWLDGVGLRGERYTGAYMPPNVTPMSFREKMLYKLYKHCMKRLEKAGRIGTQFDD